MITRFESLMALACLASVSLACGDGGDSAADAAATPDAIGATDAAAGDDAGPPWCSARQASPYEVLDLGHTTAIEALVRAGDRVLSEAAGRWLLRSTDTGARVGDGLGAIVAVGGPRFVVRSGGLCVYRLDDGELLGSVADAPRAGLASDGSYLWTASATALSIWTPAGELVAARAGDYSTAAVFAAPAELRVGAGPLAADRVEYVASDTGASELGPAFSGSFHSWFADGEHFFTNLATTVWIYDASSAQRALVSLSWIEGLAGRGDYYWTRASSELRIYTLDGDGTPAATHPLSLSTTPVIPSGGRIGILDYGVAEVTVVELAPGFAATTHPVATAYNETFSADAFGWAVGNRWGVVHSHGTASSPDASAVLGYGKVEAIDGTPGGLAAVATGSGQVLLLDAASGAVQDAIDFHAGHVELTDDGALLAAAATNIASQYLSDRSLNIYDVSDLSVVSSWPSQFVSGSGDYSLFDFALSAGGTRVGRREAAWISGSWHNRRSVTDLTGTQEVVADADISGAIAISPNGRYVALADPGTGEWVDEHTNLYDDGVLIGAVSGMAVGWIDDDQLLVQEFGFDFGDPVYGGAYLYDAAGDLIAELPVPELDRVDPISTTALYVQRSHRIYELPSGAEATWAERQPGDGAETVGAVAGGLIVHSSGDAVLAVPY